MQLDVFINPWAKRNKNGFWDRVWNKSEGFPLFPSTLSRKIRGATRDGDYRHEKAARVEARYSKWMRGQGRTHLTTHVSDFYQALVHSIRVRPQDPKIILSGDGGVKEAFTGGIRYVEQHNSLGQKVRNGLEAKINSLDAQVSSDVERFLARVQLAGNQRNSNLSPLAQVLLREREVGFDFLKGSLNLDEQERKFIETYSLTPADVVGEALPLPRYGIIRGGTFNVFAHHIGLQRGKKYFEMVIEQMERKKLQYNPFTPLRVEFIDAEGKQKTLYGSIFADGAVRGFFDKYYQGKWKPGPLKALYLSLLFRYVNPDEFENVMAPRPRSYNVCGENYESAFAMDTTVSVVTTISRLPFGVTFFRPRKSYMHTAVTGRPATHLLKHAGATMPYLRKVMRSPEEIEHSYTDSIHFTITAPDGKLVPFTLDGDIADEDGKPYDAQKIHFSVGPEVHIINPRGEQHLQL
jgi:hypothetical protein